ncbi:MAG TPA: alpha/beta hydrolase [Caulobacteraceae bacterium]|nr:alpha/beta hydrolase [Caulobacteraceae bacterium]
MIGPLPAMLALVAGLFSVAVLGASGWIAWEWWSGDLRDDRWLWLAGALLAFAALGRLPILLFFHKRGEAVKPVGKGQRLDLASPDGSRLHVEAHGPSDAPPIILTHGWGLNSRVWGRAVAALSKSYRVIVWDLPGCGRSEPPKDGRYSLEVFAAALATVIPAAGGRPVMLAGHSIGGMTLLTLCRSHPALVDAQIAGLAFVNTTYTDPTHTAWGRKLWTPLERPVIAPLSRLTIWLSPLFRIMNLLSYANGSAHVATRVGGFASNDREAIDLTARIIATTSPAVQAKGNLAMLRWDATDVLDGGRDVPTMVLSGREDILTLPEAGKVIADHVAEQPAEVVPRAGHMGFMEQSLTYNALLESFAGRVLAA